MRIDDNAKVDKSLTGFDYVYRDGSVVRCEICSCRAPLACQVVDDVERYICAVCFKNPLYSPLKSDKTLMASIDKLSPEYQLICLMFSRSINELLDQIVPERFLSIQHERAKAERKKRK